MAHSSSSNKKFMPRDDELIQVFLYNKVNAKPLPNYVTILECDLYGEKNPWEIWEAFEGSNYDGRDIYFFTTLKKKSLNGSRFVRTIGSGSWEAEDTGTNIVANGTNQCIGLKKRLRFEKSGTNHDGAWIMHEYSLDPSLLSNQFDNNCVLCRFRKNERLNKPKPKTCTKKTGQRLNKPKSKMCTKKTERGKTIDCRKKRNIVLGLAATTVSAETNDGYTEEGRRNQANSEDKRTKVVETSTRTEFDYMEQENDDLDMSWPELFSLQLKKINEGHIQIPDQEEDIPMLPNTFYMDWDLQSLKTDD